jgi:ABC-type multidrug transport system fused ATPase/permease subunit
MVAALGQADMMVASSMRREIMRFLWRERGLLGRALGSALLAPAAAMVVPFAAKLLVDDVIGAGRTDLLLPIVIVAALAVLLQTVATYGLVQAGAVLSHRATTWLRGRLVRQGLAFPVRYFDAVSTGTFVSRCMTDTDEVRILFGQGIVQLVSGALTAVLALAVLSRLDWKLTVLVVVVLVVLAVLLTRALNRLHPVFHSMSESQARVAGRLTEVVSNIRVVKAATAERRETLAITRTSHELLRVSVAGYRRVAQLGAIMVLAGSGLGLAILVLGGSEVARGAMTLGDLALFLFLTSLLGAPLLQGVSVSSELGRGLAAFARIQDVLAMPTERRDRGIGWPARAVRGKIVFDRVSYRYGSGPLVLRDLSFVAPAGSVTALVGPNGAGKTTVMGLLLGFDDPTEGRVLVDGVHLAGLRLVEYRRHVGAVLQRDHVVDGTVADNIRYARPSASLAEVRRAAQLAHCEEFVAQLPRGYETQVGERGVRLSGGQRQRLAIARAFLSDPRILLLDEATNQLDRESERLIAEALDILSHGRTTFVIAHRPAAMRRADQILVLESGTIIERGTHQELAGRAASYWWPERERPETESEIHAN